MKSCEKKTNVNCKHRKQLSEREEENQCSSDPPGEPERNRRGMANVEDGANRSRREVGRAAAVDSCNQMLGSCSALGGCSKELRAYHQGRCDSSLASAMKKAGQRGLT